MLRTDDESKVPMNRRLYLVLRSAILDETLSPGSRLPASRDLASQLKIARNTVVHAYDQLQAEGYIQARQGSGTYVADLLPALIADRKSSDHVNMLGSPELILSKRANSIIDTAAASPHQWGAFMPGVPDLTLFPYKKLGRLLSAWWRHPEPKLLSYSYGGGLPALRNALAEYLNVTRSLDCEADQIIITEGSHQAIDLASRLLADIGDMAWVENPGYWGARTILEANGLELVWQPVDEEGMCLPDHINGKPQLIFVTPSHQYPLGCVMSLARRRQLIDFARHAGCWIIEDDYDSEFRYSGQPIAALAGLESDAPVIYIGTFSKTLAPGLRVGYLVLPKQLVVPFQKAHAELYRGGNLPLHAAMATFISEGHYAAHIRRMRLVYARRRAMLVNLIERRLGKDWLHPYSSDAGLHLTLVLPTHIDDRMVVVAAQRNKILTRPLSSYYADPESGCNGLLLGYAGVTDHEMVAKFELLRKSIMEVAKGRH